MVLPYGTLMFRYHSVQAQRGFCDFPETAPVLFLEGKHILGTVQPKKPIDFKDFASSREQILCDVFMGISGIMARQHFLILFRHKLNSI